MNVENMMKLKTWLMAGAPHAILNLHVGVYDATKALEEGWGVEDQIHEKPDCGTVCCIAGAAHMMGHTEDGSFPDAKTQSKIIEDEGIWNITRESALTFLGLENDQKYHKRSTTGHYGHELFVIEYAPDNCTPVQAAQAVQNVIDGKPAWSGV